MNQVQLRDYERKKPTFEHHKAHLKQILRRKPWCDRLNGVYDDELAQELANDLRHERQEQGLPYNPNLRKLPEVHNRMKEGVKEGWAVRLLGFDGRKHNFHADVFLRLDWNVMKQFFSEAELERGKLVAAMNLVEKIEGEK